MLCSRVTFKLTCMGFVPIDVMHEFSLVTFVLETFTLFSLQLNLDDFRKIVERCNMIQGPESY